MATILVVDDEIGIRELLSEILSDEGHSVSAAASAEGARDLRRAGRPDLVLLDIWMPDTDGISLLKEWAASGQLNMPVIMMSGHPSIDSAVEAMRIGALDFLEKPIALQKLLATVKRALTTGQARTAQPLTVSALGRSGVMIECRRRLQQLVQVHVPVLLRGEPGTAAEIFARGLHTPGTGFTSALPDLGEAPQELAQRAAGGILFVDDLMALSKLQLRSLSWLVPRLERQDVRLVSFASDDPARLAAEALIEREVLNRISTVIMPLPALREHAEDIPDIANILLTRLVESGAVPQRHFAIAALNALRHYEWPRNFEQLVQVVRSAALVAGGEEIALREVEPVIAQFAAPASLDPVALRAPDRLPLDALDLPLREAREVFERSYFERLLAAEGGSMSRVSERSGMERTHLYRKLKQLGLAVGKRDEG